MAKRYRCKVCGNELEDVDKPKTAPFWWIDHGWMCRECDYIISTENILKGLYEQKDNFDIEEIK